MEPAKQDVYWSRTTRESLQSAVDNLSALVFQCFMSQELGLKKDPIHFSTFLREKIDSAILDANPSLSSILQISGREDKLRQNPTLSIEADNPVSPLASFFLNSDPSCGLEHEIQRKPPQSLEQEDEEEVTVLSNVQNVTSYGMKPSPENQGTPLTGAETPAELFLPLKQQQRLLRAKHLKPYQSLFPPQLQKYQDELWNQLRGLENRSVTSEELKSLENKLYDLLNGHHYSLWLRQLLKVRHMMGKHGILAKDHKMKFPNEFLPEFLPAEKRWNPEVLDWTIATKEDPTTWQDLYDILQNRNSNSQPDTSSLQRQNQCQGSNSENQEWTPGPLWQEERSPRQKKQCRSLEIPI